MTRRTSQGSAAALASATGLIRSEVGKQLGMRHVPTLEFVARRAARRPPATSTILLEQGARVRRCGAGAKWWRRTPGSRTPTRSRAWTLTTSWTTRSTRKPTRKPTPRREPVRPGRHAGPRGRRQARPDDLARRGRPDTPARGHPQGGARGHPRPDGDRRPLSASAARPGCSGTCAGDKTYDATIRLGEPTTTDDAEGELSVSGGVGRPLGTRDPRALAPLSGAIDQVPLVASARSRSPGGAPTTGYGREGSTSPRAGCG